jgi:iron-sulfur cluster repair protein YtfE (RIC family)
MSIAANEAIAHAMHSHHQEMLHRLRGLTAVLAHAGAHALHEDQLAVVNWCRSDLLPHAMAEEQTLYPAASRRSELAALVTAMIREHRNIGAHVDRLAAAAPGVAALEAATVLALFESHLEKEEFDILPALVPDATVELGVLLEGMHELLGAH